MYILKYLVNIIETYQKEEQESILGIFLICAVLLQYQISCYSRGFFRQITIPKMSGLTLQLWGDTESIEMCG